MLETSVSGNSGMVSYSWAPATGLDDASSPNPTANPAVTTTYTLTATDEAMCSDMATITVYAAPAALSAFPVANGNVNASVVIGNIAYVGGAFTQFGGMARNRLAAVDLNTGEVTSWNPGANNTVFALETDGTNIYVGGQFTTLGGNVRRRAGAVTLAGVATAFDPDVNGTVRAIALSGGTAYLGGEFTDVGAGSGKQRLAAVDKTSGAVDMAFDANANNTVRNLLVDGGTLYVGGDFSTIQSTTRNRAAAIDLATGLLTGFNPNANNSVRAIASYGGFIYIGGDFTQVSTLSRPRLARLNPTTGAPATFAPAPNNTVSEILISDDHLYLGGSFTSVLSSPRTNVAAIDLSTDALKAWNPSVNNTVETIFDYGCRVFIGGAFTGADGRDDAAHFAALNDGEVATINVSGPAIHCPGTPSTLTVTGGDQYLWCNNGETTASIEVDPAMTTNYTVAAIVGGCVVTAEFTLNAVGSALADILGDVEGCDGEILTLDAGDGFVSYQWFKDGGELVGETGQTLEVTTSGVYSVDVVNAGGCADSDDVTVVIHPNPVISITPDGPTTFCAGGSVVLDAGEGYATYLWNTGEDTQTITVTESGEYDVVVTDGNGCVSNDASITVTVNALPEVGVTPDGATEFCIGGSVVLNADAGFASYQWYESGDLLMGETGESLTVSGSGNYSVVVSDGNGCSDESDEVAVVVNPLPMPSITPSGPTTFCVGGDVTLDASDDYETYQWYRNGSELMGETDATLYVTTAGDYSVTVVDANGCTNSSDVVTVVVNGLPEVIISASGPTTFCAGGSVTLDAGPGFESYLWSPGGETTQTIVVTESGNYTVDVADNNGCEDVSDVVTVTVHPLPTATISPSGPTTFCLGGSVTLDAGDGYAAYQWIPGGESTQTIEVSASGEYSVIVTDMNGCEDESETVTVTVNPLPTLETSGDVAICVGSSTTLTVMGAETYSWEPGDLSGSEVSVSPSETTTYTVTGTDENGCQSTATVTVSVNELPEPGIWFGGGGVLCPGSTLTLYADEGYASYVWFKEGEEIVGETGSTLVISVAGEYTVIVTDENGCSGESSEATVLAPAEGIGDPLATLPAVNGAINAMVRVGNILYIGGAFTDVGGEARNRLAAVDLTDGSVTSWNPDANNNVFALEYQDGWIYVGGQFTNIAGNTRNRAAALTPDGTLTGWNPNANGNVRAIEFKGDTVFLGGQFTNIGGSTANRRVAAVNKTTGARYPGLAMDIAAGNVRALSVDKNSNTLFIGGNITAINGSARGYVGAVNTQDGTLLAFNPNLDNQVFDLAVRGGRLYIAGQFTNIGGDANFARLAAVDAASGMIENGFDPNVTNNRVNAIAFDDDLLMLGGTFTNVNGSTRQRFAVVDANTGALNAFVRNVNNAVNDLDLKACDVIIGGAFTNAGTRLYQFAGPATPIVSVMGDMTACAGDLVTFTASGAENFLWCTVGQLGSEVTVQVFVTETFTVYGYNDDGCRDMEVFTVTVNPLPVAEISPSELSLCDGANATLDAGAGYVAYQWYFNGDPIDGETNQTLTVTEAGEYTVWVENINGCVDTSDPVVVVVNPLPTPSVSYDGPTEFCAGGSLVLDAGAGYAAYQWLESGNPIMDATGQTYEVTTSGDYSVVVTDENGCQNDDTTPITVVVNDLPTPVATTEDETTFCNGGSAFLEVNDDYESYQWYNDETPIDGAVGESITVTTSGEYFVVVFDAEGCSNASNSIVVTVNPLPMPTISSEDELDFCDGGSALLETSGSYAAYQWYFDGDILGGETASTFTAMISGEYFVVVTDDNGCSNASNTIEVIVYENPTADAGEDQTICLGDVATLDASASTGDNLNYGWAWTDGSFASLEPTFDVSPAVTTTYTLVVIDERGCFSATDLVVVTVNPLPTPTITPDGPTTFCFGNSVTLDAGDAYESYQWYLNGDALDGETASTLTVDAVEASGDYAVRVTDENGCAKTSDAVTVTVNALPEAVIAYEGETEFCDGGSLVLDAGEGYATYQWLESGDEIDGANGQTYTATVSGVYSVFVVDMNGCEDESAEVAVVVNPNPSVDAGEDQVICFGFEAELTAEGTDGTGELEYSWAWTDMFGTWTASGASITVSPPMSTTYTVTVTDSKGCTDMDMVTVTVNSLPIVTVSTEDVTEFCFGESALLTATSGFETYQWYVNGELIEGAEDETYTATESGDYTVVVTDENGCNDESDDAITIIVNPTPVADAGEDDEICFGAEYTLNGSGSTGTGDLSYFWAWAGPNSATGATVVVSPTVETTYTLFIVDSKGCISATDLVTIFVNPLPSADAGEDQLICLGSETTLTAMGSGGTPDYEYSWAWTDMFGTWTDSGESINVSPTETTTYTLTVTDSKGCTATDMVTVNVTFAEVVITPDAPTTFCAGDVVVLDAGESFVSYQWYLDEEPIEGATESFYVAEVGGVYSVMVTDENGCTDSEEITVTVWPMPDVSIIPDGPTEFCPGETVTLDAGEWVSYLWSTGDDTREITVSEAGIYTVLVENEFGCYNTADISIVVYDVPEVNIEASGPVAFCAGGSVTLDAGEGFAAYLWSTEEETQAITVSESGVYTVTVIDTETGCAASKSIEITVFPLPVAMIEGDDAICDGDVSVLTTGEYVSYQWYFNETAIDGATEQTFAADLAGVYAVWVTDENGCTDLSDEFTLVVNALPNVEIVADGPFTICAPGSLTLDAGEWVSYLWSTGDVSQTITVSESGTFSVTVFDENGCFNTSADVVVTVLEQMEFDVEIVHPSCGECTDGEIVATGTSGEEPFLFTLNGGDTTDGTFTGLGVGFYEIDGFDDNGCSNAQEVELVVCDQPIIVSVDQISGSSARVIWNSEQPQVGAPYGRFWMQYRETAPGMGTWTTTNALTDTVLTLSALNSSYTYEVRVRYECSGGYSVWSNASTFTTLVDVCNAPTAVTTSSAGVGNRNVSWGGTPNAISYAVAYGSVLVSPSTWATVIVGAPSTTTTLTGLNPSTTYRVRVLANCTADFNNTVQGVGTSPWSTTSMSFKPNAREGFDASELQSISLYPNPNNGMFNIVVKSAQTGTALLNLTDALGRTVYQTRFEAVAGDNQFHVSVPGYVTTGVYMVNLTLNGVTSKTKVVIE